jgi:Fe-S oxidoreductase
VDYTRLVQRLREVVREQDFEPECPHGGALQSVMRMMAQGGTEQERLGWLGDDLATAREQGEVFYWTGCAVYYDAFFKDLGVAAVAGARAAIQLLNRLGVNPVVSPRERCCGHDLLWSGDRANFELLARHNIALVAASGARRLVTSCAECLRTWKLDYAPLFAGKPPEILHITELLAEHLPELALGSNGAHRVTFQDPCRMGRHLGLYEAPRRVLRALPGIEFAEMRRHGPNGVCCAGGTWSHCDRYAKQIQVERLQEARATGAEILVTACPKCQIHFRCAMRDPKLGGAIQIEMHDVAALVAGRLASRG